MGKKDTPLPGRAHSGHLRLPEKQNRAMVMASRYKEDRQRTDILNVALKYISPPPHSTSTKSLYTLSWGGGKKKETQTLFFLKHKRKKAGGAGQKELLCQETAHFHG